MAGPQEPNRGSKKKGVTPSYLVQNHHNNEKVKKGGKGGGVLVLSAKEGRGRVGGGVVLGKGERATSVGLNWGYLLIQKRRGVKCLVWVT